MEIIKLRAVYPTPARSVEEMRVLADVWMEDFADIDDAAFQAAIREHRTQSKYWPTTAELLELRRHGILRPDRPMPTEPAQLTYSPTEAEIAENLKRVKALTAEIFKDGPDPDHADKVKAQARAILEET